jgi:hypothetical protein
MQRQTLASALNAALSRQQRQQKQPPMPKDHQKLSCLVAALEQSATRMDQIIQRRIGLNQEPAADLK